MILQVETEKLNEALALLGNLSGEVSFTKVQPIITAIQSSIIRDKSCQVLTLPNSSSQKSETEQSSET